MIEHLPLVNKVTKNKNVYFNSIRFVKILFWVGFVFLFLSSLISGINRQNSLVVNKNTFVVSIIFSSISAFIFMLNMSFLFVGKIWTFRKHNSIVGPYCDCCISPFVLKKELRSFMCCGCTCLSRPYLVCSTFFFVISILTIVFDIAEYNNINHLNDDISIIHDSISDLFNGISEALNNNNNNNTN